MSPLGKRLKGIVKNRKRPKTLKFSHLISYVISILNILYVPEVGGSSPPPATKTLKSQWFEESAIGIFLCHHSLVATWSPLGGLSPLKRWSILEAASFFSEDETIR